MYEKNYEILKQVCAEKAVIRPVAQHRKPDGSMDVEGNLRLWNEALARFELLPLWEKGAPGYDGRDPLQPPARGCTWRRISRTPASTPPSSPTA